MRSAKATVAIAFTGWLLLAGVPVSQAQTYVSLGYGGLFCTEWTARKPLEARSYTAWVLGYLSAYNAYVYNRPNVVEGAGIDDVRIWVDSYCKQNPRENLDTAVRELIDEQIKNNPKQ